ncbi:MAG: VOC family protein [Candidatus Dadabacteria bacterium]|nr:VOC family protein [Candidatus Dadabacteria bacterium]NIS10006.1 VOC family protein [Candidatus Dadabacteria bacterium]NIV43260.1 glyoxalase [Candidatus Dadabacteria bacterium]NIX16387.1 glyoxalase [Candidatus Dadabacteria bacterium]NIY22977.1 glyoxalase [Candidatus Dadabacteria bacterium]
MKLTPFHIAVQVRDIDEAREFYENLLGLEEGRSDDNWMDFNMYGHQYICHLNPDLGKHGKVKLHYNPVDEHSVPVPHAGVVLEMKDWIKLSDKLTGKNIEFVIEPYIRFKGRPGEQATMFFLDPSGNALEFKSLKNIEENLFTE